MKRNKSLIVVGAVALGLSALLIHGQKENRKPRTDADTVVELKGGVSPYSFMPLRSVPGNYLAARFAVGNDDLKSANQFYLRAITSAHSAALEEFLFERSLPAAIGAGDMKNALAITQKMDLKKPTATAQLAALMQIIDGFKNNDSKEIAKLLPALRNDGFGRLLKPLLEAWSQVANEDFDGAIMTLNRLAKEYPSLRPLTQMHLAFVHDLKGDDKKAEHYYKLAQADHLSVRAAYLIGQFYEHKGNKAKAVELYRELDKQVTGSPLPEIIVQRLESGKLDKTPYIRKPSDGVAAALYDVATVLYQENSARLAVLYAQMAHYLTPDDEFTTVLLGDILTSTNVSSQAEEYFASIPESSDLYTLAQLRLAQLYEQQENHKKAVAVLKHVEENPLTEAQALMALGDLYRRQEDFEKAIPYYTKLLKKADKLTENDWVIFYARGICYERSGNWEKAEADLLQALKLSPQQPEVLNYLAYSWADHGKNLPKSLEMLQKALAGAPDDPYIADSVGWALYKIGHVDQAMPYLEAAIEQLPDDPILNSHLGDIYWSAGRRLEAQFQWERALKNTKETDAKARLDLQERLESGLPSSMHKNTTAISASE